MYCLTVPNSHHFSLQTVYIQHSEASSILIRQSFPVQPSQGFLQTDYSLLRDRAAEMKYRYASEETLNQIHGMDMIRSILFVHCDLAVQQRKRVSESQSLRPVLLCLAEHDDSFYRNRFIIAHL